MNSEDEKVKRFLQSLDEAKLAGVDDFHSNERKLGGLIKERFGKGDLSSTEGLAKYAQSIKNKDYEGIDDIRKILTPRAKPILTEYSSEMPVGEGIIGFDKNEGRIKVGSKLDKYRFPSSVDKEDLIRGVLGHELGHANDYDAHVMKQIKKVDPDKFSRLKERIGNTKGGERFLEHVNSTSNDFIKGAEYAGDPTHHLTRKDIPGDKGIFEARNISRLKKGLGLLGAVGAVMAPDAAEAAADALVPGGMETIAKDSDAPGDDSGALEMMSNNPGITDPNIKRQILQELALRNKAR